MWTYLEFADDEHIRQLFDEGVKGVSYLLANFDTGYWSKYDLLMTAIDAQKIFLSAPRQVVLSEIAAAIGDVHVPLHFIIVEATNLKNIEG